MSQSGPAGVASSVAALRERRTEIAFEVDQPVAQLLRDVVVGRDPTKPTLS